MLSTLSSQYKKGAILLKCIFSRFNTASSYLCVYCRRMFTVGSSCDADVVSILYARDDRGTNRCRRVSMMGTLRRMNSHVLNLSYSKGWNKKGRSA